MSNRPERVAQLMRREIAEIIQRKLNDPRMTAMISVTDVEVTHDLSSAKIFVGIMPEGPERDKTLEGLRSAAGFVRHELAPRLGLREVPQLRFVLDTSMERGARVEDLLRRLGKGETIDDEDATP
jgi:ribosome-binding factor A